MTEFDYFADIYDAIYSDRKEDVEFYVNLAKESGGLVLECGCGTGRVLLPIAQAGLEIWGIDGSQAMLEMAESKIRNLKPEIQKRVQLSQQDMSDFQLGQSFCLCIVPFRAFLHLLTMEDQDRALTQMHKHLKHDGMLVLDIFAPSYELLARGTATMYIGEKFNRDTGRKFTTTDHVRYEHASQLIHVERFYDEMGETGQVYRKVFAFTLRYVFRFEMQALLVNSNTKVTWR